MLSFLLTCFLSFLGISQAMVWDLCENTGGRWDTCGSGCGPLTCRRPGRPEVCPEVCVEQCDCGTGNVWDVDQGCITLDNCTELEQPGEPGTQPGEPGTQPGEPGTQPGEPGTQPGEPGTQPLLPQEPGTQPGEPGTQPQEPGTQPTEEADCNPLCSIATEGGCAAWSDPIKSCGGCTQQCEGCCYPGSDDYPQEPGTQPGEPGTCFEKRVHSDKCVSEHEFKERAGAMCRENGARLVGLEVEERCNAASDGVGMFRVAGFKCCGAAEPEPPTTKPEGGECFEKRVHSDKCVSEHEFKERAGAMCRENGARLVGLEVKDRCDRAGFFQGAGFKCCGAAEPEPPATKPTPTRPATDDELDVGKSCFEVTLRGKGSTCGSLLRWHRFANKALGESGFLYVEGIAGQEPCSRKSGQFSQARVRACVSDAAVMPVALSATSSASRASAGAPASLSGASVLLGAQEVYMVEEADFEDPAEAGGAAATSGDGGVSVLPIVGGAGVALVAAAVVAMAVVAVRRRGRAQAVGANGGSGVRQLEEARAAAKASVVEYPNGAVAAFRADPITISVAPVVVG